MYSVTVCVAFVLTLAPRYVVLDGPSQRNIDPGENAFSFAGSTQLPVSQTSYVSGPKRVIASFLPDAVVTLLASIALFDNPR